MWIKTKWSQKIFVWSKLNLYIDIYSCEPQIHFGSHWYKIAHHMFQSYLVVFVTHEHELQWTFYFQNLKIWQYTKFWSNENLLAALGVSSLLQLSWGYYTSTWESWSHPINDWYSINFTVNVTTATVNTVINVFYVKFWKTLTRSATFL